MNDVGMLDAFYSNAVRLRILNHDADINNGALFENAAVQQLLCNGFTPYYFRRKALGEVVLLIEKDDYPVPIEIKSGKSYQAHTTLDNLLDTEGHDVKEAYVFSTANVQVTERITYLSIYLMMFLKETEFDSGIVHWSFGKTDS